MSDRRTAWMLFGALLCAYLLTSGGHFYSADGGKEYEVTRALVTRRAIDIPQGLGLPGRDAKFYPPHGVGQSIVWIPFYAAGSILEKAGFGSAAHGLAASWLNAIGVAATAALLFLLAREIGVSRGAAIALVLTFGFATMAWVYSKNTFDVVLTGALVTAGTLLLVRARARPSSLVGAAVAFGWAGVTRAPTIVLWPVAAAFVLLSMPGAAARDRLRRVVAFGAPLGASLGVVLAYNYARFGSVFDDGHKADRATAFTGNFFEGFFGYLVSPARGVVFFAPIVLVSLVGWRLLRRRDAALAWFVLASFLTTILVYAKVEGWQGGFSWGPRFLLPTLPLAVLPAALVFERWRSLATAARTGVAAAVVAGVLLTLPGVLADYQLQTLVQEERGVRITRVWDLSNAAYVYHTTTLDDIVRDDAPYPRAKAEAGRLARNTWDFWWWYAIVQRRAVPLVIVAVLALIAGVVLFARAVIVP